MTQELYNTDSFRLEEDDFVISGIRYARPGAVPILLVHGFMSNCFIWESLAGPLYQAGFDVWIPSMRGHGNAHLRSFVKQPQRGSYGFSEWVTGDLQAICNHIFTQTNQPLWTVGHSNGANALRATLQGILKNPQGKAEVDSSQLATIQKQIRGFVALGSPQQYAITAEEFNLLVTLGYRLSRFYRFGVPTADTVADLLIHTPDGPQFAPSLMSTPGKTCTEKLTSPSLIQLKFFTETPEQLPTLLQHVAKSVSAIPTDLTVSYLHSIQLGKMIENGFNFSLPASQNLVPSLYIAGEHDQIAPARQIENDVRHLQTLGGQKIEFFVAPETGHYDLVLGTRATTLIGDRILKFLSS